MVKPDEAIVLLLLLSFAAWCLTEIVKHSLAVAVLVRRTWTCGLVAIVIGLIGSAIVVYMLHTVLVYYCI